MKSDKRGYVQTSGRKLLQLLVELQQLFGHLLPITPRKIPKSNQRENQPKEESQQR
ncbi:MAG: hypothetical protein P8Y72_01560 [Anaerolineales bacterium]